MVKYNKTVCKYTTYRPICVNMYVYYIGWFLLQWFKRDMNSLRDVMIYFIQVLNLFGSFASATSTASATSILELGTTRAATLPRKFRGLKKKIFEVEN